MIQIFTPALTYVSEGWGVLFLVFASYVLIRAIVLQGGLYILINYFKFGQNKKIFKIHVSREQYKSELLANLQTILFDSFFFATLVKFGPALQVDGNLLISFLASFIWFEIWFYISHRAFHTQSLYFIHRQHHVAKVTSPLTALSFSIVERTIVLLGGVLPIVLVGQFFSFSATGIALYFFVNYLLNIYGHSNLEIIPPSWLNKTAGRILNTSTYHALHHARYTGHFGLFTPFLDQIFSTQFQDYRQVQAWAYRGQGLSRFHTRFSPPVALITGASSGIGQALAIEYINKGYRVSILARRFDRLEKLKHNLGPNCLPIEADVTIRESLDRAVDLTLKKFGQIDVVIANAGTAVYGKIENLEIEDYKRQFETNVFGVINTLQATLSALKISHGRFAIVGSVYSYLTTPALSPYTMSKYAVRSYAESLQIELKSKDISVTLICPGLIESELRLTGLDGIKRLDGHDPMPSILTMSAGLAARKIKEAIDEQKRVAFITGHAKLMIFFRTYFPRIYMWLLIKLESFLSRLVLQSKNETSISYSENKI